MAGYCAKMSLAPLSSFLSLTRGFLGRSSSQFHKSYCLCQYPLTRNFRSTTCSLDYTRNEGNYSSVPSTSYQQFKLAPKEKGITKADRIVIREEDTSLVKEIHRFRTATDLLLFMETVDPNLFDDRTIDVTTRCLFSSLKQEVTKSNKKAIFNSVGMQKLCRIIKQQSRFTGVDNLISMFKVLTFLNAPADNITFQIILRLLSKHANALSLSQIMYLDFLVDRLDPVSQSPLSHALKLALPVVFESQVNLQINGATVKEMYSCMLYACNADMSPNIVQTLIDAISQYQSSLSSIEAYRLLFGLGDYKQDLPQSEEFINYLFKLITSEIHTFDARRIGYILSKCVKRVTGGGLSFWYNEDLTERICNRLTQVGNESIIYNFKNVSLLRHVNLDFMEAVADMVVQQPSIILNNDDFFRILLRGFSGASYKPEQWKIIHPMLVEHPTMTKTVDPQYIPLMADFLVLDIFSEQLARKIFAPENSEVLYSWCQRNGPYSLLSIWSAIRHIYREYKGPLPSNELVNEWLEQSKNKRLQRTPAIEGALQTGLGGSGFVVSNLHLDGIFIDYCVAMHRDGYPIQIKNTEPFMDLQDVEKPTNSSMILIRVYGADAYARNTNRLRGVFHLESKILKSTGHPFIEVDSVRWAELLDIEKIPWLMQKIKESTDRRSYSNTY